MTSSTGASRAVAFPFDTDFVNSKGKVLDFLSSEGLRSSLESLRLWDVDGWLAGRTRLSAVGSLAMGRGTASSVLALLEGVFSGGLSACRSL